MGFCQMTGPALPWGAASTGGEVSVPPPLHGHSQRLRSHKPATTQHSSGGSFPRRIGQGEEEVQAQAVLRRGSPQPPAPNARPAGLPTAQGPPKRLWGAHTKIPKLKASLPASEKSIYSYPSGTTGPSTLEQTEGPCPPLHSDSSQ